VSRTYREALAAIRVVVVTVAIRKGAPPLRCSSLLKTRYREHSRPIPIESRRSSVRKARACKWRVRPWVDLFPTTASHTREEPKLPARPRPPVANAPRSPMADVPPVTDLSHVAEALPPRRAAIAAR